MPQPLRLREIREDKGLTIEQAAFDANIERTTFSRIERGYVEPSPRQVRAIERVLGEPWEALGQTATESST